MYLLNKFKSRNIKYYIFSNLSVDITIFMFLCKAFCS